MSTTEGTPASMALDDQLCFALYSASLAIQRLYRPRLEALGLTYPQYLVLLVLWEDDGVPVSTIGERLGLNSATLTPLLKRLEAAGLVTRTRDQVDERRVIVELTTQGRGLQAEVQTITTDVTCAAADGADDAGRLVRELTELRRSLPHAFD